MRGGAEFEKRSPAAGEARRPSLRRAVPNRF
jgi:hypothetical protein